jgi:hypothetical protein
MSLAQAHDRLQLPETLEAQLYEFRRRVWSIKLAEAVCAAVFTLVVAFLAMFALDRIWDTPGSVRTVLFVMALCGCAILPLAIHRWIWRNRRLEQLALLLSRTHPRIGDQLLGVIELVRSDAEQARSWTLCEAAINQVAEDAHKRDFRDAVPNPRHRLWAGLVTVPAVVAVALVGLFPAAGTNAWARFLVPWKNIPRYTFAAIEPLPSRLVVAHGEPFSIKLRLLDGAIWRPERGVVQLDGQRPVAAKRGAERYAFELPAQLDPGWLRIRIGDSRQVVRVEPTLRPELRSVVADVRLPEYLGLPQVQHKDVRGGSIALVKSSRATFAATASRALASASVNGQERAPAGATITSDPTLVDDSRKLEFRWRDEFGLAGKEAFTLTITGRDDEPPSLTCEDLPRQKVVLDSETLNFKVKAQDDFGLKQIGMEWHGIEDGVMSAPASGERVLAAGGHDKETLESAGTFCAKTLGIEPQPINLRVFVEDFLPGRARVYSPTYVLYVLTAEQHAIWLTEQLSKWHRQSLEVRDREMTLHETNKQLRALSREELDQPENRRRIENQASAEHANGRRLSNLVANGEELVRQATRNPEFGVGHLEKWAEMLQILKDIAGNRMPSVADLLTQAAQSPSVASNTPTNRAPIAGQIRDNRTGKPSPPSPDQKKTQTAVPQVVDRESSQLTAKKKNKEDDSPSNGNKPPPSLRLPTTTLAGGRSAPNDQQSPAAQKVDEAVKKQEDLLAEFEKIAEELNRVLANLEGSTLVKRLKAASRMQYRIADRMDDRLGDTFGVDPARLTPPPAKLLGELAEQEAKGSQDVSYIMDDMQAYFERRQYVRFKTVLDDMKKQDVVGSLRQLGDDLKKENGVSIAQCEYWSDTLDRWAEDLVDPTRSGKCPGAKSRASLPPSLVLEVLQILESEVNLREETRVAEQARPALASDEHGRQAQKLSGTQKEIAERTEKVEQRIRDLPDSVTEFGYEIQLMGKVAGVMNEATEILARPETGAPAIAAETEAIELLLQSRRINPRGGGGGGSTPGGGGTGSTQDSALALLGGGVNDKEVREDRGISQASGEAGPTLPEEFRAGLDQYFNRLERNRAGQ